MQVIGGHMMSHRTAIATILHSAFWCFIRKFIKVFIFPLFFLVLNFAIYCFDYLFNCCIKAESTRVFM